MDASHASASGTAADDFETRLRIMNENLTFSERLEYLDDPDWAAFVSSSGSKRSFCRDWSSNCADLSLASSSIQNHACPQTTSVYPYSTTSVPCPLSGSRAEPQTPSVHMTGHTHAELPILAQDSGSPSFTHDDASIRQESNRLVAGYKNAPDSDGDAVSKYQCVHCPRKYQRKADLHRHAKSHDTRGRFDCPISTCKFRGRKGNPRQDKFINHLLKGHPQAETWPCLIRGCSEAFENVLLLGVHLDGHNSRSLGKAMVQAHSMKKARCPIGRCGKPLTPNHLFEHHTQMERQAEADSLCALGFDHQQSAILCPICHEKFMCSTEGKFRIEEDLPKLREHMGVKHVGYSYKQYVPDRHVQDSERLLSMWKDPHTLYRCREQILRFGDSYRSAFHEHAMFNDVRA